MWGHHPFTCADGCDAAPVAQLTPTTLRPPLYHTGASADTPMDTVEPEPTTTAPSLQRITPPEPSPRPPAADSEPAPQPAHTPEGQTAGTQPLTTTARVAWSCTRVPTVSTSNVAVAPAAAAAAAAAVALTPPSSPPPSTAAAAHNDPGPSDHGASRRRRRRRRRRRCGRSVS
jgi:hypothetical protein